MKRVLMSFVFMLAITSAITGRAESLYAPDAIEISPVYDSIYPRQLAQPLDILPEGFNTVVAGNSIFYYGNGVFYQRIMLEQKYVQVPPPIGIVVTSIPDDYQLMVLGRYYVYESHGIFYVRVLEGYRVIPPPIF